MIKTLPERALWYHRRLSAMSAPEIGHRLGEQVKRTTSRYWRPPLPASAMPHPGQLPMLPALAEGVGRLAEHRTLRERLRVAVNAAETGRFRLLGATWPAIPGPVRWHLDPVTGRSWPTDEYCFSIPYRHAAGMGDVKYVWELNRLPHVQEMALLAVLEHDDALAGRCLAEIESWIDANPPFAGVNWASGIELSLRVVSIMVAISLIAPAVIPSALKQKLRMSLAAHGYWLMRYPSRFSSANNHLIAEAGGLYLLGTLAPDLAGAETWARYGRHTLIDEAQRQIHADGVGAEQSPTYTAFTLEWLLLCGVVAERMGEPFPPDYWDRIERAGEFLRWITDAAGHMPRIGDDDEGCVLHSGPETDRAGGIMAALAAMTGRAELAPPRSEPHLRDALFGTVSPHPAGPTGVRGFPHGGYTVVRSGEGRDECLLVFDHGPLGYLSIAAHGHADALAIWLHVGGRPVLVDAGTYLYHSGAAGRDHFRGTAAHNTLAMEGADSSIMAGAFNWSEKAMVHLLALEEDPQRWMVEAEHDGFTRRFGMRHRRRVARTGARSFLIEDRLIGNGPPRLVEVGFLAHPDLVVDGAGHAWTIASRDGEVVVRIGHDGPLAGVVQHGEVVPERGWYSPAFGTKAATSRLAFVGTVAADVPCSFAFEVVTHRTKSAHQ